MRTMYWWMMAQCSFYLFITKCAHFIEITILMKKGLAFTVSLPSQGSFHFVCMIGTCTFCTMRFWSSCRRNEQVCLRSDGHAWRNHDNCNTPFLHKMVGNLCWILIHRWGTLLPWYIARLLSANSRITMTSRSRSSDQELFIFMVSLCTVVTPHTPCTPTFIQSWLTFFTLFIWPNLSLVSVLIYCETLYIKSVHVVGVLQLI